jgi:outer membrane receptor protein involved in Fe transport
MGRLCVGLGSDPVRRIRWLLTAAAIAFSPPPAATALAQEPTVLRGMVADEATLEAIPGALVVLPTLLPTGDLQALEVLTDGDGVFSFAGPPAGAQMIRVRAPGYVDVVEEIQVAPGRTFFLSILLPPVNAVLEGLIATAPRERGSSSGAVRTAADLVALRILGASTANATVDQNVRSFTLRGRNTVTQSAEPAVYLDGIRVGGSLAEAFRVLEQIPAMDVGKVEVLRGPASTVRTGDPNGVILVSTRRGADEPTPE